MRDITIGIIIGIVIIGIFVGISIFLSVNMPRNSKFNWTNSRRSKKSGKRNWIIY